MDEYYCSAYPQISSSEFFSEVPLCPDDQYFNVKIECINSYVLNARKIHTYSDSTYHDFTNVSKDEIMQETTIMSWLSQTGLPKEAHKCVVTNITKCARDMANWSHKHTRVLSMHVSVYIILANEDETSDEEDETSNEENLVPVTKSFVEGLEMVEQDRSTKEKCAICFEDLEVGVNMPCLHKFHKNCIRDWLQVANSCPLCRFYMPTDESE